MSEAEEGGTGPLGGVGEGGEPVERGEVEDEVEAAVVAAANEPSTKVAAVEEEKPQEKAVFGDHGGPPFVPADADPPIAIVLTKTGAVREDSIISKLRAAGVVPVAAKTPKDVPQLVRTHDAELVFVNVVSNQSNSEAVQAVRRLSKAGVSVPLMAYTAVDPDTLTDALRPIISYGLVALFRLPVADLAFRTRILTFIERRRKALAVYGEVATIEERTLISLTAKNEAAFTLKEEEQLNRKQVEALHPADAVPEVKDGLIISAPKRGLTRPERTSGGWESSTVEHEKEVMSPVLGKMEDDEAQMALSLALSHRAKEKFKMAVLKAAHLAAQNNKAFAPRRRRTSLVQVVEDSVQRRRSVVMEEKTGHDVAEVEVVEERTPPRRRPSPSRSPSKSPSPSPPQQPARTLKGVGRRLVRIRRLRRRHSTLGLNFRSSFVMLEGNDRDKETLKLLQGKSGTETGGSMEALSDTDGEDGGGEDTEGREDDDGGSFVSEGQEGEGEEEDVEEAPHTRRESIGSLAGAVVAVLAEGAATTTLLQRARRRDSFADTKSARKGRVPINHNASVTSTVVPAPKQKEAIIGSDLIQLPFKEPWFLLELASIAKTRLTTSEAQERRIARGLLSDSSSEEEEEDGSPTRKRVKDTTLRAADNMERAERELARMEKAVRVSGNPVAAPSQWLVSKLKPALAAALKSTGSSRLRGKFGSPKPVVGFGGGSSPPPASDSEVTGAKKDEAMRVSAAIGGGLVGRNLLARKTRAKEAVAKTRTSSYKAVSQGQHLLRRGFELRLGGDFAMAIGFFTQALEAEPSLGDALLCRGVAHAHMANFDAALEDFSRLLRSRPRHTGALFNRAILHTRVGNDDAALHDLDSAILLEPTDPGLFHNRALIHRRRRNFAAANDDYVRSFQLRKRPIQFILQKDATVQSSVYQTRHYGAPEPEVEPLTLGDIAAAARNSKPLAPVTDRPRTDDPSSVAARVLAAAAAARARLKEQARLEREAEANKPLPDPLTAAVEAAKVAKAAGGGPAAVALAVKKAKEEAFAAIQAAQENARKMMEAALREAEAEAEGEDDAGDGEGDGEGKGEGEDGEGKDEAKEEDKTEEQEEEGKEEGKAPPSDVKEAGSSMMESVASAGDPLEAIALKAYHEQDAAKRVMVRPRDSFADDGILKTTNMHTSGMRHIMNQHHGQHLPLETDVLKRVFYQPTPVQLALRTPAITRTHTEVKCVLDFLLGLQFVRELPTSMQRKLARAIRYTALESGHVICEQGHEPTEFYILMSGTCQVKVKVSGANETKVRINTIKSGTSFGETGLIRNTPRSATILTASPCELLWVNDVEFKEVGLFDHFEGKLKARVQLLLRAGIFGSLSPQQMLSLASIARPMQCERGKVLQRQGALPDALYILTRGVCRVLKFPDDQTAIVTRLKKIRVELLRLRQSNVYHHSMRLAPQGALDAKPSHQGSLLHDTSLLSAVIDGTAGKGAAMKRLDSDSPPPPPAAAMPEVGEALQLEAKLVSRSDGASVGRQSTTKDTYARVEWLRNQMLARGISATSNQPETTSSPECPVTGTPSMASAARAFLQSKGKQPQPLSKVLSRPTTGKASRRGQATTGSLPRVASAGGLRPAATTRTLRPSATTRTLQPSATTRTLSRTPVRTRASSVSEQPSTFSQLSSLYTAIPATAGCPDKRGVLRASLSGVAHPLTATSRLPSATAGHDPEARAAKRELRAAVAATSARWDAQASLGKPLSYIRAPASPIGGSRRLGATGSSPARSRVGSPAKPPPEDDPLAALLMPPTASPAVPPSVVPTFAAKYIQELEAEEAALGSKLRRLRASADWGLNAAWHKAFANMIDGGTVSAASSAENVPMLTGSASASDAVELCKLFPVSFFGEMAVLDPWEGMHEGTVVTETYSEVLVISKKQMDLKSYPVDFIRDVRRRSVVYPTARAVRAKAMHGRKWEAYRRDILEELQERKGKHK